MWIYCIWNKNTYIYIYVNNIWKYVNTACVYIYEKNYENMRIYENIYENKWQDVESENKIWCLQTEIQDPALS